MGNNIADWHAGSRAVNPREFLIDCSDCPRKIPFGSLCLTVVSKWDAVSVGDFLVVRGPELDRLLQVKEKSDAGLKLSDGSVTASDVRLVSRAFYRGLELDLVDPRPKLPRCIA